MIPQISEIAKEHKGNHPRFMLDKYPNVWLILKLYKKPGSPKTKTERNRGKEKQRAERKMDGVERKTEERYEGKK